MILSLFVIALLAVPLGALLYLHAVQERVFPRSVAHGFDVREHADALTLSRPVGSAVALSLAREALASRALTRALADKPVFSDARTGDAAFDALFEVNTQRTDAVNLLRRHDILRDALRSLFVRYPELVRLDLDNYLATFTLSPLPDSVMNRLTPELRRLLEQFDRYLAQLPADTPAQRRARRRDQLAVLWPVGLLLVGLVGALFAQRFPLLDGVGFAWRLAAAMAYATVALSGVMVMTHPGRARRTAVAVTLALAVVPGMTATEAVVALVNQSTHATQRPRLEPLTLERLEVHSPRRGQVVHEAYFRREGHVEANRVVVGAPWYGQLQAYAYGSVLQARVYTGLLGLEYLAFLGAPATQAPPEPAQAPAVIAP